MRVFALSDIHVDFDENAQWILGLSKFDYQDDLLILAGDVTHKQSLLEWCLRMLTARFKRVQFVPGNHDLWVLGEASPKTSLEKFAEVRASVENSGASMNTFEHGATRVVPLLSWYDFSFGSPSEELMERWMDFRACRWPEGYEAQHVAEHFAGMNEPLESRGAGKVITYSHFLPRMDLLPNYVSSRHGFLVPVLGSERLEQQVRAIKPDIHVYGHSHINRSVKIEGINYVNSAFGYPRETHISQKRMLCIDEI